jgi:hypothetical protein
LALSALFPSELALSRLQSTREKAEILKSLNNLESRLHWKDVSIAFGRGRARSIYWICLRSAPNRRSYDFQGGTKS